MLAIPLMLLVGWFFLVERMEWGSVPFSRADFSALGADTGASGKLDDLDDATPPVAKEIDTTAHRILFFGDSMVEGLKGMMAQHAAANGHELTSIIWYSSTTDWWANTDTLQHFIQEVRPTYILICLGANELFVRDLLAVDKNIANIVRQIGKTPFAWISPPNWKEDTGINELIIKNVGADRYFDSRHLELARRSDHAHPTPAAAVQWCNKVCAWLSTLQPRHPIRMQKPVDKVKRSSRVVVLQPMS